MPKSEFQGRIKNEIDFNKQRARHPDKFLGIDLREYRALTLPKTDLDALKYQVGKNSLKSMPLSPDPKQFHRKPLFDHSIDFNKKGWRDFVQRPKNIPIDDTVITKIDNDPASRGNLDLSDAAILGDVLKLYDYDVTKSYEALGHVKKLGNTMSYAKMQPQNAVSEEYDALPSFMVRNVSRNGVEMISEKTLAAVESEKWRFYDPPTTFKTYSNSQLSIMTTKLKAIMREKSHLASQKRNADAKAAMLE